MGFISKSYLSTQLTNFSKRIEEVFTKKGHKHTKSDITDFPTSLLANGGISDYAKKLQTYKEGSTTETYGDYYPLYAQWRTSNHLRLKCDNYITETDYADNAGTVNGHTVNTDVPSWAVFTDTNTWRPIGTGANDAAAGNHTHSDYGTTLSLDSGVLKLANGSTKIGSGVYVTTLYDDPETEGMENCLVTLKSTHDMMADINKSYAPKDHNHDTAYQPKGNYVPTSGNVTVNGTIKFYGAEQRFCPWGESYSDPMYGYTAAIKASGTSAFQNIYLKDGIRPSGASTSTYPVVYKETGTWIDFSYTTSHGTWGPSNNKYVRQGDLMICSAYLNSDGSIGSNVTLTINDGFPTSFTSSQLISAVAYQPYVGYKTGIPQPNNTIIFSGLVTDTGVPPIYLNIVYRIE